MTSLRQNLNLRYHILTYVFGYVQELHKLDTEALLKHRMMKFRKIGGFQEGIPIDPKKKKNMKPKEEPVHVKTPVVDLEGEVEKVKQQILKAKESSNEPPLVSLTETIEKLRKEVDTEFSEAVKALGLKERFATLREEFAKVNAQNQLLHPALKAKLDKLREEFNKGLLTAPNYEDLKYKLDMLKELSKAYDLAESNKKAAKLKQEVNKKFSEIMDREDVKEKVVALRVEVENSGLSKFDDLDDSLKEKIMELKKELEFEFIDVLKSLGLDVELKAKEPVEQTLPSEVKNKIEELNGEINERIESVINSTDLKDKIELLKLEIAKAGKTPDSAAKNRIMALEQQIKQSLAAAVESSNLKEKHEKLKAEISQTVGSNGSLKKDDEDSFSFDASRVVGANRTFG